MRLLRSVFSGGYLEVIPRYSVRYDTAKPYLNDPKADIRPS